jgi:peroxiredoxin
MRSTRRVFVSSLLAATAPWAAQGADRSAAGFKVNMPGGGFETMSKYKGKLLLLCYFSSDCRHCQQFMTSLDQVYRANKDKGMQAVGISVDADEPQKAVSGFVGRHQITFPVGWVGKDDFFKYTAIDPNTRPFVPILAVVDQAGLIKVQFPGNDQFMKPGSELKNLQNLVNGMVRPAGAPAQKKK